MTAQPAAAEVDYLDVDPITVPGQQYVLLSFVSPTGRQKSDALGVKVRGAFATRADAEVHAKKLRRVDPVFDILVADMYAWLPCPPDVEKIEDQEYANDQLNALVKGHKEQQIQARLAFEARKREVMEKGLEAALTEEERLPPPTIDRVPTEGDAPVFKITDVTAQTVTAQAPPAAEDAGPSTS